MANFFGVFFGGIATSTPTPTPTAPRVDNSLVEILRSVRRKIILNVHGANEENCYITIDPLKFQNGRSGDFFYTVSPFRGKFNESMIDGGGRNQVTTHSLVTITIFSIQNLDRPDEDHEFLCNMELGLIQRFDSLLTAFTSNDLTDQDDNDITFEPIIPESFEIGRERGRPLGWMQLVMNIGFDWNLSD